MICIVEGRPAFVFNGNSLERVQEMSSDEFLDYITGDYASFRHEADIDRYEHVAVRTRPAPQRNRWYDAAPRESSRKTLTLRSWRQLRATADDCRKATVRRMTLRLGQG